MIDEDSILLESDRVPRSAGFLSPSPHSRAQQAQLLSRLAALQRTLLQAVPAVTRFLAQYLPLWDEREYFFEVS